MCVCGVGEGGGCTAVKADSYNDLWAGSEMKGEVAGQMVHGAPPLVENTVVVKWILALKTPFEITICRVASTTN